MAIHNYQKWRTLALLALGLCFLLELLSIRLEYGWMRNSVQSLVTELEYPRHLNVCPTGISELKSQHFFVLILLLPLKAISLYLCWPGTLNLFGKRPLEAAWGVLVVTLYALLGMLFAYLVLFQLPGAPSVSSRSFFANLTPCGPPTIEYVMKMFMLSVVAAICMWPAIGIVSSILRRPARS